MSDTPRTDEIFRKYTSDIDRLDALDDVSRQLERELAAAQKENDMLRGLLGNSAKDCIYCGLPAAEQARCPQGFPGCSRSDDQMLSQHFADAYRANEAEKELAAATAQTLEAVGQMQAVQLELKEVTARAESAERDALMRALDVFDQYFPRNQNGVAIHCRNAILALIPKEHT